MNKQLPPFFIITGSCVRSQTFTPKYTSTETWVRYSDFVDYFPVALDECAEDKVALSEENARLKAEVQRDTEIHRRNTAMWKDDCEYHHAENARLKAEVERLGAFNTHTIIPNEMLKAEVERLDTLCKQLGNQHSDISCENIMLRKQLTEAQENYQKITEWSDGAKRLLDNYSKMIFEKDDRSFKMQKELESARSEINRLKSIEVTNKPNV